ncbi:type II secretion system minor pseudopilin GspJ [Candidatus Venteria ishoeyi]|uniref:Type II secretion system protein J n=1 Tax=Candidatus Venteria ishoeyi TaxID=1899563 RepID=A0A1H6FDT1_9GAMM|nr:type II secretion system minor pseudopilin GspJ [Candidatus Venteria ishoeyi]MDM8546934.1 type II secretion system minor pseudopilin GspJ [Candidatus Venteria ishoeyi]SEH07479.1 Type II secretion system protein J precursor [Candidatus Venteria ishoeyi]
MLIEQAEKRLVFSVCSIKRSTSPNATRHFTQCGFTLLELLVALAIFSIMASMAYAALNNILKADVILRQQSEQLAALQHTFTRMALDIEQYTGRSVRDPHGDKLAALVGMPQQLSLTRTGRANPLRRKQSHLQRLRWQLEEQVLYRESWPVLDAAQNTQKQRIVLLNAVENLQLRYLDQQGNWHVQWPPLKPLSVNNTQLQLNAVEVQLSVTAWGKLRWLFELVNSFK